MYHDVCTMYHYESCISTSREYHVPTIHGQGVKAVETAPWAKRAALESAVALLAGLSPEAGGPKINGLVGQMAGKPHTLW